MARYVMTARRKAALRKAQLVSARKRRGRKLSRRKKAVVGAAVVTAGAVAVGGVAYRSYDKRNNITLYHGTSKAAARSIRKNGFRGASSSDEYYASNGTVGRVYFTNDKKMRGEFGEATVKIKMPKKVYEKLYKPDPLSHLGGYSSFVTLGAEDIRRYKPRKSRQTSVGYQIRAGIKTTKRRVKRRR